MASFAIVFVLLHQTVMDGGAIRASMQKNDVLGSGHIVWPVANGKMGENKGPFLSYSRLDLLSWTTFRQM